jgi:hypothetical protein
VILLHLLGLCFEMMPVALLLPEAKIGAAKKALNAIMITLRSPVLVGHYSSTNNLTRASSNKAGHIVHIVD